MAVGITQSAATIFAPTQSNGAARRPSLADTQRWGVEVEALLGGIIQNSAVFSTRAEMNASLSWPSNTLGLVAADEIASNRGVYRKIGASGFGSWVRVAPFFSQDLNVQLAVDAAEQAAADAVICAEAAEALDFVATGPFAADWSNTVNYVAGNRVLYDGEAWYALLPSINKIPGVDAAFWEPALGPMTAASPLSTKLTLAASTTSRASMNIPSGGAPSSPADGDLWRDGVRLRHRIAGFTNDIMQPFAPLSWPTGLSVETLVASSAAWASFPNTTVIPFDDTVPLVSEGAQILSGSFTSRAASATLEFEAVIPISVSAATGVVFAIFVGSTCVSVAVESFAGLAYRQVVLRSGLVSLGSVSPVTVSVRVGNTASGLATISVNGNSSGRLYGGASVATLTVSERSVYTP